MDAQGLIIFLAIGALAGWLAGKIMKGGGFGLVGNIIVGVVGAIVGGYVFNFLGISDLLNITMPSGTGIPYFFNNSLDWCS